MSANVCLEMRLRCCALTVQYEVLAQSERAYEMVVPKVSYCTCKGPALAIGDTTSRHGVICPKPTKSDGSSLVARQKLVQYCTYPMPLDIVDNISQRPARF